MKKILSLTILIAAYATSLAARVNDGFILVEGGTFRMGCDYGLLNERPGHFVTLNSFYMCDHEVSQAEYEAVMRANPSEYVGKNQPVGKVSWYDAIEFCNKMSVKKGLTPCYSLNGKTSTESWGEKGKAWDAVVCDSSANGYRLPTEAEWEFAARGGNKSEGYRFSGGNQINTVAWTGDNRGSEFPDVKTKTPNELGLYDMSGNVYEWCWDWYADYSSDNQTNPRGAASGDGRIIRGGSFWHNDHACRVINRCNPIPPEDAHSYTGFRMVRSDGGKHMPTSSTPVPKAKSLTKADDFVFVEGGVFQRGNEQGRDNAKPVHYVTLASFHICNHEVTQAEYEAVMGANPSLFSGTKNPVEQVTLYDAFLFCNKLSELEGRTPCYYLDAEGSTLNQGNIEWFCDFTADGYRLPTESEWEYAARGGVKSKGYTYSGSDNINDVAWYVSNSGAFTNIDGYYDYNPNGGTTHEIRQKRPNELGLYDMTGNVSEWVWDNYTKYSDENWTNPKGAKAWRSTKVSIGSVVRGGNYRSNDDDKSNPAVYARYTEKCSMKSDAIGFRLAHSESKKDLTKEIAKAQQEALQRPENKNLPEGFVCVKGGTFKMGSDYGDPDEKPVHNVTLNTFYMCDHEVTEEEYLSVMSEEDIKQVGMYILHDPGSGKHGVGPNSPRTVNHWITAVYYCNRRSIKEGLTPCYSYMGKTEPATWSSVKPKNEDFATEKIVCDFSANGYRLPTEAEWEYAASGGNKSHGYAFSGGNSLYNVAWITPAYSDQFSISGRLANPQIHEVKTRLPNELGIFDMTGNLLEWCWDIYGEYNGENQTNPTGAASGQERVLRGGGVFPNFAFVGLYSYRICDRESRKNSEDIGLRLVRSRIDK